MAEKGLGRNLSSGGDSTRTPSVNGKWRVENIELLSVCCSRYIYIWSCLVVAVSYRCGSVVVAEGRERDTGNFNASCAIDGLVNDLQYLPEVVDGGQLNGSSCNSWVENYVVIICRGKMHL